MGAEAVSAQHTVVLHLVLQLMSLPGVNLARHCLLSSVLAFFFLLLLLFPSLFPSYYHHFSNLLSTICELGIPFYAISLFSRSLFLLISLICLSIFNSCDRIYACNTRSVTFRIPFWR